MITNAIDEFSSSLHAAQELVRARNLPRAKLTLERHDLVFHGSGKDQLQLQITLRNPGIAFTNPALIRISTAPFGAFVPWQPALVLPVGSVPPGGTTTLRTAIMRSPDGPRRPAPITSRAMRLFLRSQGVRISRHEPHVSWAGNVNVFVHGVDVERHRSPCLGLVPDALNVADFVVGGGPADAYEFDMTSDIPDCELRLQFFGVRGRTIPLSSWVEFHEPRMAFLLARTPARANEGTVQVHVRQRSSGREAVVEFAFGA